MMHKGASGTFLRRLRSAVRAQLAGSLAQVWLAARRAAGKTAKEPLRILIFHEVRRDQFAPFARLVDRLQQKHRLITPREAESFLSGACQGEDGRAPYLLTFDDGFKSNFFAAREVLGPRGVSAIFFICPGLVGLSPESQKEAIAQNIRDDASAATDPGLESELMSWDDIQALAAEGHGIGSHSWSHRRLSTARAEELESEIGRSAQLLRARLKIDPRWFAYPFGNVSSISTVALAGVARHHLFCRSGIRGPNVSGTPPLGLLAQHIDLDDPLDYQLAVAAGALDFRYRAARCKLSAMVMDAGRLKDGGGTLPTGRTI